MNATRPTNIQCAIDETIAKLAELRNSPVASFTMLNENNPGDIDALAVLAGDLARACDGMFHEIAATADITSRSGASPYAVMVQDTVDDNLASELRLRAATMSFLDSQAEIDRREHGTLDLRTQGIGR